MDSREKSDLAAEFALGLLEGRARRAAERRLRTDPAFRAQVHHWQTHLAPLVDAPPARPPPAALDRIEARLFGTGPRHRLRRLAAWIRDNRSELQVAAVFVAKAGLLAALALWLI